MTDVVYITPVEHEIAKLMAEYGPKWGLEVSDAVEAMALAEADSEATTDRIASEGQQHSDPNAHVEGPAVETEPVPVERVRLGTESVTSQDAVTDAVRSSYARDEVRGDVDEVDEVGARGYSNETKFRGSI